MSTETQTEWFDNGTLVNFIPSKEKGVYIFVFEGNPSRIVYVGICYNNKGFSKRWSEHLKLFKTGGRTVWRVSENDDINNLMSYENDMVNYYKKLALESKLWVPNHDRNKNINYLNKNDYFSLNWKEYVENIYIKKLRIWSCPIEKEEHAKILETQIQKVLGKKFHIGYYSKRNQNWMGDQQIKDEKKLSAIKFKFKNYPKVDSESEKILKDIYNFIKN